MNEGLFSAYSALPAWRDLLARLPKENCIALTGMAEGEKPFFAAALAHRTGRPVLLISPTELVAQKQAQDVNRLTGGGAAMLPARDVQFSRAAASQESTWQRLHVLGEAANGRLHVLCVSAEGMLDRCLCANRFQKAAVTVTEGMSCDPIRLIEGLVPERLRACAHGGRQRPMRHARGHSGCIPAQRDGRAAH